MLAAALIIVGLLILVISLPPLVLDLTGHIRYVPAGSSDNWFKQTLTGDTTKYIMLGTGVLVGTVFTGLGIWYAATSSSRPTPKNPITRGYQKIPTYGSVPRSESVKNRPPNLSRVNTPQSNAPQSEYAEVPDEVKRRSSQLAQYNPDSPYGSLPAFKTDNTDKSGYGNVPEKLNPYDQ